MMNRAQCDSPNLLPLAPVLFIGTGEVGRISLEWVMAAVAGSFPTLLPFVGFLSDQQAGWHRLTPEGQVQELKGGPVHQLIRNIWPRLQAETPPVPEGVAMVPGRLLVCYLGSLNEIRWLEKAVRDVECELALFQSELAVLRLAFLVLTKSAAIEDLPKSVLSRLLLPDSDSPPLIDSCYVFGPRGADLYFVANAEVLPRLLARSAVDVAISGLAGNTEVLSCITGSAMAAGNGHRSGCNSLGVTRLVLFPRHRLTRCSGARLMAEEVLPLFRSRPDDLRGIERHVGGQHPRRRPESVEEPHSELAEGWFQHFLSLEAWDRAIPGAHSLWSPALNARLSAMPAEQWRRPPELTEGGPAFIEEQIALLDDRGRPTYEREVRQAADQLLQDAAQAIRAEIRELVDNQIGGLIQAEGALTTLERELQAQMVGARVAAAPPPDRPDFGQGVQHLETALTNRPSLWAVVVWSLALTALLSRLAWTTPHRSTANVLLAGASPLTLGGIYYALTIWRVRDTRQHLVRGIRDYYRAWAAARRQEIRIDFLEGILLDLRNNQQARLAATRHTVERAENLLQAEAEKALEGGQDNLGLDEEWFKSGEFEEVYQVVKSQLNSHYPSYATALLHHLTQTGPGLSACTAEEIQQASLNIGREAAAPIVADQAEQYVDQAHRTIRPQTLYHRLKRRAEPLWPRANSLTPAPREHTLVLTAEPDGALANYARQKGALVTPSLDHDAVTLLRVRQGVSLESLEVARLEARMWEFG